MAGAGDFSGTVTPGRYRIVGPLPHDTASARAKEARHDHVAGRFALERYAEVEARAFQRAVLAASALHHPGIARVVDYGVVGAGGFVVTELVEGRSLATRLAEDGPLDATSVAALVDSIALGLQAAHRQGLAHGRLAPDRIFALAPAGIESIGEPTQILGFGVDAVVGQAAARGPYTAPEQLAGTTDARSDQYALAAIAYELLTGVRPFGDGASTLHPPSLREYEPRLNVLVDDVMKRALSAEPAARFPDVYTFSNALRAAMDTDGSLEERTRLAPLPLTRPASIHIDFQPPVIASVDIDLSTPAPHKLPRPLPRLVPAPGETHMNQPPLQLPSTPRSPSPSRTYSIQPTPTFSFTDEVAPGPRRKRPRGSGGGLWRLFILMLLAGAGGYAAVKYRAWENTEPLVNRATALARSLGALAPSATPAAAPPAATPAPAATTSAPTPATAETAAPTAVRPDNVLIEPIEPDNANLPPSEATAARAAKRHAERARRHHGARAPAAGAEKSLSDEEAAEEALLASPR